jgi:DNA repair protein RadA/Sms
VRPIDPRTLVVGEVGLAGEVRGVGQVEARLKEAEKMGFERALLPASTDRRLAGSNGLARVGVDSLEQVWNVLFQ